ncbi:hypothetical protein Y032_0208g2085 [Ancylostoma ceylanicum]|nr:hypothetical protein Y032_0208g2085 [Ancylostoma ceylanicum]
MKAISFFVVATIMLLPSFAFLRNHHGKGRKGLFPVLRHKRTGYGSGSCGGDDCMDSGGRYASGCGSGNCMQPERSSSARVAGNEERSFHEESYQETKNYGSLPRGGCGSGGCQEEAGVEDSKKFWVIEGALEEAAVTTPFLKRDAREGTAEDLTEDMGTERPSSKAVCMKSAQLEDVEEEAVEAPVEVLVTERVPEETEVTTTAPEDIAERAGVVARKEVLGPCSTQEVAEGAVAENEEHFGDS